MRSLHAVTAAGPVALPVAADATSLTALYRGLDLGVYTALRTFDGNRFLDLGAHLARSRRSMVDLGWTYQLDIARLCEQLDAVCVAAGHAAMRVRLDVLASPLGHAGGVPGPAGDARELIGLESFEPLPPAAYEEGVSARVAHGLRRDDPKVKRAAFIEARQAFESGENVHEHLIADAGGYLLEGFSSNFYGVRGGTLYTAGEGVLEGITRKIILEQCAALDIPVVLEAPHKDSLAGLQEAAISSASRGYLPVVSIDGQPVGSGRPGPVAGRLMTAYEACVQATAVPATAIGKST